MKLTAFFCSLLLVAMTAKAEMSTSKSTSSVTEAKYYSIGQCRLIGLLCLLLTASQMLLALRLSKVWIGSKHKRRVVGLAEQSTNLRLLRFLIVLTLPLGHATARVLLPMNRGREIPAGVLECR